MCPSAPRPETATKTNLTTTVLRIRARPITDVDREEVPDAGPDEQRECRPRDELDATGRGPHGLDPADPTYDGNDACERDLPADPHRCAEDVQEEPHRGDIDVQHHCKLGRVASSDSGRTQLITASHGSSDEAEANTRWITKTIQANVDAHGDPASFGAAVDNGRSLDHRAIPAGVAAPTASRRDGP